MITTISVILLFIALSGATVTAIVVVRQNLLYAIRVFRKDAMQNIPSFEPNLYQYQSSLYFSSISSMSFIQAHNDPTISL
jgi:hypothetical protein